MVGKRQGLWGMVFGIDDKSKEKFYAYQFNEYLADIRIAVENLKRRTSKKDSEKIQEQFSKINKSISGIMGLVLEYAEKTGKRELFLASDALSNKKALVGSATKQALLKMGEPAYEIVVQLLYRQYQCGLADCFEHPEYLNKILKELFGKSHIVIVELIKKQLEEFSYQKPIKQFLVAVSK